MNQLTLTRSAGNPGISRTDSDAGEVTVSFIIPAFNEEKMLGALLQSIGELQIPTGVKTREIIVADANSTDSTRAIAQSWGCRVVSAARGAASIARNAGAATASGDVLAFIDADCVLPCDWLNVVLHELRSDGVVAAATQMAPPHDKDSWVAETWHELTSRDSDSKEACDCGWLPSFNLAVKSDSFRQVGGFDESLVTCEDVELGLRLACFGRLRKCSGGLVPHIGASDSLCNFFQREAWRAKGSLRLLVRHWRNPNEVLSTLIPFFVTLSVSLGFLAWSFSFLEGLSSVRGPAIFSASLGIVLVFLLAVRQRVSPGRIPKAMALLSVYCAARSLGSITAMSRLNR